MIHTSRISAAILCAAQSLAGISSIARAADTIPVPISYYAFDEPNGSGTLTDSIRGAAGLGTIYESNGNPTNGTFVQGKVGSAMQFDGATYVSMNTATGATQYSVSSWVYLDATSEWASILKNWGSTQTGALHLGLDGGGTVWSNFIGTDAGTYGVFDNTSPAVTGAWVNVAATFNGEPGVNQFKLYVNGQNVDTQYADGTVNNYISLMSMGAKLDDNSTLPAGSFTGWLTGKLDEIAFWDVALTPGQISSIYTDGLNGISPIPVPEPSTYALAGLSAIALIVAARQRRRNDLKPAI